MTFENWAQLIDAAFNRADRIENHSATRTRMLAEEFDDHLSGIFDQPPLGGSIGASDDVEGQADLMRDTTVFTEVNRRGFVGKRVEVFAFDNSVAESGAFEIGAQLF